MTKKPITEPIVLPDVATEPHPTAHAIPEPPGTVDRVRPDGFVEDPTASDEEKDESATA